MASPTNQVSGVTVRIGENSQTFTYTYDQNGNITSISDGTYITSYTYDSANQLIREDNQEADTTTLWSYDNGGNILTRTVYPYTTEAVGEGTQTQYRYHNTQWGDLLTAYGSRPITRDEIGNPQNDFVWKYTWQHGRQLASMQKLGGSETWEYTYNADGLRTQRTDTVTGLTYSYTYLGDQLTHMTVDGHTLYFTYDASGTPLALDYDGHKFYYITNLQGDVISIVNGNGTEFARYTYDAWGNVTTDGSATNLRFYNPLRYRGYVYDEETGLYYLQSRYYNPEMGRFINADAFPSTGQGFIGNNMFAYCGNDPVNRTEIGGYFWDIFLDIVSLGSSIIDVIRNPDDPMAWLGVAADVASLAIPGVSGGSTLVRAVSKADDVVDAVKTVDKIDEVADAGKALGKSTKNARSRAVRKAWRNEVALVESTGKGTRNWTGAEIDELLNTGKIKGYVGHHMKSVKGYPGLAGDPLNIQFLTRKEHLLAHGGNWRNITHGRYIP